MRYFKKIKGERLYLSPMNVEDAEIYTKWINDPEVSGYLGNSNQVYSLSSEKQALGRMAADGYHFSVVALKDDVLLGNISLMEINHISRSATLGLFIGEAENRSKGYGQEAIRLLLGYGFQTLNLHNIMLLVHSDNERAIGCYQKAGFREFGRRREAVFKNGSYYDLIYMEILDTEYHS